MTTAAPTQFLYPYAAQPSVPIQNAGTFTTVSGPTTFTQNVTATRQGTLLIWIVAVNASAGAALGTTPAGWTLVATRAVATLVIGIYAYYTNPGGITSVTLSGPTATTGGIAGWFIELPGGTLNDNGRVGTNVNNGSSTTPSPGANYTATYTNEAVIGVTAWVSGGFSLTVGTTTASSGWQNNATQTSTNGTTNASLQVSTLLGGLWQSTPINVGGTLSGSTVWCDALVTWQTGLSIKLNLTQNVSGTSGFVAGDLGSYAVGG